MGASASGGRANAGASPERVFETHFGRRPIFEARAPGRVNLIGEHTDYNQGLVLPCAIDLATFVWAAPRDDRRARVWARDLGEQAEFEIDRLERRGDWLDYVQGVVHAFREAGLEPAGFDLAIESDLPSAAGLSSSAALELAVVGAIDALQGFELDATTRAKLGQRAENEFVGVRCGPMDQLASAHGRARHALLIDCRSAEVRPIAVADAALALLVVHSGVARRLAEGVYERRVRECHQALKQVRAAGPASAADARSLRDLHSAQLPELARALDARLLRRVRHVITENERVGAFCEALERADRALLGHLLHEGQRSLREDYEVSLPELDALCEIGERTRGVVGSRLTGAGLGGCSLHLVESTCASEAADAIAEAFAQRFGARPRHWLVHPAKGAGARRLAV